MRVATIVPIVAFAFTVTASPARADSGPGAFRLGMHVPLGTLLATDSVGGSAGDPLFDVGIVATYGLDFGYQVTDMISVGAMVVAGTLGTTSDGASPAFALVVLPRFELAMAEGPARVYGAVELGLGAFGIFGSSCSGCSNPTYGGYGIGGEVGAHLFAEPSFSIDPYFAVRYLRPVDLPSGVYQISVGVSLIGWIGGAPAPTPSSSM